MVYWGAPTTDVTFTQFSNPHAAPYKSLVCFDVNVGNPFRFPLVCTNCANQTRVKKDTLFCLFFLRPRTQTHITLTHTHTLQRETVFLSYSFKIEPEKEKQRRRAKPKKRSHAQLPVFGILLEVNQRVKTSRQTAAILNNQLWAGCNQIVIDWCLT